MGGCGGDQDDLVVGEEATDAVDDDGVGEVPTGDGLGADGGEFGVGHGGVVFKGEGDDGGAFGAGGGVFAGWGFGFGAGAGGGFLPVSD